MEGGGVFLNGLIGLKWVTQGAIGGG